MRDLDTPDTWTADDDDFLRGALLSLRADVDAAPLADPEGARSSGDFRRRRRMLGMTAGVAAAVAIVAALGFRGLVDDDALPPPQPAQPTPTVTMTPSRTPTPTPTPTTSPSATPSATNSPRKTNTGSATPRSTPRPTSSATGPGGNPSASVPPGSSGTPVAIVTAGTPAIPVSAFLTTEEWQAANTFGGTIGSVGTQEIGVGEVTHCDPNAQARPAALGWVTDVSGWSGWNAVERIQASNVQSDGSTNAGEPSAIVRSMLGNTTCQSSGKPVTFSAGPRPGTVKVEYTEPDSNSGALVVHTDLLGAVALKDGQRTATFVLTTVKASDTSWAFLGNLMDAAARK